MRPDFVGQSTKRSPKVLAIRPSRRVWTAVYVFTPSELYVVCCVYIKRTTWDGRSSLPSRRDVREDSVFQDKGLRRRVDPAPTRWSGVDPDPVTYRPGANPVHFRAKGLCRQEVKVKPKT